MKIFICATLALMCAPICARAVPITLRVADAAGAPVGGVSVEIIDYADVSNDKPTVPRIVKTAADGTLALDLRGVPERENVTVFVFRARDEQAFGNARVINEELGYGVLALIAGENELELQETVRVAGTIKNAAGAPIAGAQIRLLSVEKNEQDSTDRNARYGQAPVVTTTKADGTWEFAGLPRGYAEFSVKAPGAADDGLNFQIADSPTRAPDLKLRDAGIMRGRILDFEGKPVANAYAFLDDDYGDVAYSDAQGRFELPGVPVGESALAFNSMAPDWLGASGKVKVVIPARGATVDIGDVRADKGLLISGTVRDQDSKLPVANLKLRVAGSEMFLATDVQGRFAGRVRKPFYGFDPVAGDYTLKNNAAPEISQDLTKFDMGEILAQRGIRLPLDVRDETGAPVPEAMLRFSSTNVEGAIYQRDSKPGQPSASVWPIPIAQYKIEGRGVWEVIGSPTVSVTASDVENPQTVAVRVKQLEPIRVSGRVVDKAGQSVKDVSVKIGVVGDDYRSARSGRDGTWQLEFPVGRGEPIFNKAESKAFRFARGGEMTRDGAPAANRWRAADIIMARTDATLAGRVVGADGVAAMGARVGWNNDNKFESAATDNAGRFEIKGLTDLPTTIYAASRDGLRAIAATATPGTDLTLKLAPTSAPISDDELEIAWEQLPIERLSQVEKYFAALGNKRVYEVARRLDANADPTKIGGGLDDYLRKRAQRARTPAERADFAREGIALLRRFDINAFSGGMARVALAAARSDDDELRAYATRWIEAQKTRVKPLDSPDKVQWYDEAQTERVLQVGAALGQPDAIKYRDIWLVQIDRPNSEYLKQFLPDWGETLWDANPQWFDEIVGQWPASQQIAALSGALRIADEPAQAKELLARLEELANEAPAVAAVEGNSMGPISPNIDFLLRGQINFARAMALADPIAALDALDKFRAIMSSGETDETAATIARAAIENGDAKIARRALEIGLKDGSSALALIARDFDADLAARIMEVARQNAMTRGMDEPVGWTDVTSYAIALSEFDPAQGRLLLEDQWAKRQQTPPATDEVPNADYAQYLRRQRLGAQYGLARAMAFYDVPRALQWASEIKDDGDKDNNGLDTTRLAIIVAALTPPSRRAFLLGGG